MAVFIPRPHSTSPIERLLDIVDTSLVVYELKLDDAIDEAEAALASVPLDHSGPDAASWSAEAAGTSN